ncbi:bacillithiol system redox-active protein YtxJ [Bacillus sp. 31A1R]|uniref:Bacillithiol system redox-active protein YtxJ n=1 Tax=Robertmurraya mangrovi TaxID=3098077 RepID=A0ABU5IZG1_9BACI|nr:bacillithiol system redox-active protein YtxJ [Bacillus sp. 31A1R]MDZ5472550.1 bacillithiol system redox-active protein YtxJ [Bacillus sp. 31A1R]
MKKIDSVEEFEALIENEKNVLLVKHSLTCPISHAAFEEYESFVEENAEFNNYYLAVQDSRPLSNYIAEKFQIKHESPQALLFSNGEVVWHASHWKITYSSLTKALEELNQ